jgi:hypothetical protein
MAEPRAAGSAPPPLQEALGWIGFRIDDMNGSRVARLLDVYVDIQDGEPVWLIVKVGRFGKVTAIPYADCAEGPGLLWVAHPRKTIRAAPALRAGKPLLREQEQELCEHYLIRSDRGRHEVVSGRPDGAETARPAERDS